MKTGLISGIISLIIVIIISITAGNWQYIYYISGPLGILLTAIALVTLLDAFRFETRGPYFTPVRQMRGYRVDETFYYCGCSSFSCFMYLYFIFIETKKPMNDIHWLFSFTKCRGTCRNNQCDSPQILLQIHLQLIWNLFSGIPGK